jgi:hypothetical protein
LPTKKLGFQSLSPCGGEVWRGVFRAVEFTFGLCGVSAGPFGGTRVIQNLLPVMRELGLVTIFYDLNFSNVQTLFDESGNLIDKSTYVRRMGRFMDELVWMSTVHKYGRQVEI